MGGRQPHTLEVMALILILKALVDVSHVWFTLYNPELLLWVTYHVKIKHMANSCRSQKLNVKYLSHWIFSVSEGVFYRTVNRAEWSFSDSEKYSWSQTLLSRESSSFAIIGGTEAPSTKHSRFFNKWHWTPSHPTAAFSVWNTNAVKSQKLQRKLFIVFSPWSTDREVHFLEFCEMTFFYSSDLCKKSLSQSPNVPVWLICFSFGLWVGSFTSETFSKFTFVHSSPSVALCSILKNNCISCNIMC